MRQREKAVLAGTALLIGYEIVCKPGETISDWADDMLERYPKITAFTGAIVVAHVFNVWENYHMENLDPIHRIAALKVRKEV